MHNRFCAMPLPGAASNDALDYCTSGSFHDSIGNGVGSGVAFQSKESRYVVAMLSSSATRSHNASCASTGFHVPEQNVFKFASQQFLTVRCVCSHRVHKLVLIALSPLSLSFSLPLWSSCGSRRIGSLSGIRWVQLLRFPIAFPISCPACFCIPKTPSFGRTLNVSI